MKTTAHLLTGMSLPQNVALRDVLQLSTKDAHERLVPHFAGLVSPKHGEIKAWTTPRGMIDNILGANAKLTKKAPIASTILGLSLAPAASAGLSGLGLCPMSTRACRSACISETGQYRFDYARELRIRKTQALIADPVAFLRVLFAAIQKAAHKAIRDGEMLGIRLNTLSDVPWETLCPGLFAFFDSWPVQFYDYTKIPGRITPKNYDLTFSRTGHNDRHVDAEIARGSKIAVVFPDSSFPASYLGIPVVDGDQHDARWTDRPGAVVGLRWKVPAGTGATRASAGQFVAWPDHGADLVQLRRSVDA